MKVVVIGTHLCTDTLYAINKLMEKGHEVGFKDILACHEYLKEYLALRDSDKLYDGIRNTNSLGVPLFIKEDGTKTLDLNEVL